MTENIKANKFTIYSGNRKRRIAEAEMFLFGTYDLEFYERCVGD